MIISELNIPFYQFKIENWKDKKNNLLEIYSSVENILTSKDPTSLVYTDFGISKINYVGRVVEVLKEDLEKFYSESKIDLRGSIKLFSNCNS